MMTASDEIKRLLFLELFRPVSLTKKQITKKHKFAYAGYSISIFDVNMTSFFKQIEELKKLNSRLKQANVDDCFFMGPNGRIYGVKSRQQGQRLDVVETTNGTQEEDFPTCSLLLNFIRLKKKN